MPRVFVEWKGNEVYRTGRAEMRKAEFLSGGEARDREVLAVNRPCFYNKRWSITKPADLWFCALRPLLTGNGAKIDSKQNSPKAWWHTVSGDEIHQLLSNEASDNHLNNSNHCAFHQSAQYHKVIRYKPCEERGGVWEPFVPWPNLATPGFKQGTFDSSGFSARETPVSASTVPNCATELRKYVVRVSV